MLLSAAIMFKAPSINASILKWIIRESELGSHQQKDLLKKYHLSELVLDDVNARIPFSVYLSLIDRLAILSRKTSLGLELGLKAGVETLGAVGYMFRSAETLSQALKMFEKNTQNIQDSTRIIIDNTDTGIEFIYSLDDQNLTPRRQDAEFSIGVMFNLICQFLPHQFNPEYVTFEHKRHGKLNKYESSLCADVFFEQDRNAIGISSSDLQTENPNADQYLISILQSYIKMQFGDKITRASLVEQIKILINSQLTDNKSICVHTIAMQLGMNAEQLNRRLKKEDTNFRKILLYSRMEIAKRLLLDTDDSILLIAQRVGYSDSSAFCRAFNNNIGVSANKFRQFKGEPC